MDQKTKEAAERKKAKEAAERKLRQLAGEDDDSKVYKWKMGKNYVRFFPRPGEDQFFAEVNTHFFGGIVMICLTNTFGGKANNVPAFNTRCPLCRRYNKERQIVNKKYGRGNEKSKAEWFKVKEEWAPRVNYYACGYDPTEDDPEVHIYRFGSQVLTQLLTEYTDADIEFFSISRGRTMTVKKIQKKNSKDPRDVEYVVVRGNKREDISEIWDQVKDDFPDLEAAAGKRMTAEEIEELIKVSEVDYEEEEDEEEEDEDEEEEDEDEDEDEDDEEEEEEGDDEEEGEEEKPTKKSKVGLKPRCFGDPDTHDPSNEICTACPWFKRCAATPDVAEAYDEGRYERRKKNAKVEKIKRGLRRAADED